MKKKLLAVLCIISIILIMPQAIKAAELESNKYAITDTYVSRIEPETTVEEFKRNLNASSAKIYKDSTKAQEVTNGNIATNMCVEYEGTTRTLSVIGDINSDGYINELDLALMIRHVLEFGDSKITDEIKKLSADISGDKNIDIIDITALIRYTSVGDFHVSVEAPEISRIDTVATTNSIKITVDAKNAENGIYQYLYKKEGEVDFREVKKTSDNSYTITELEENTKYIVKVKVTNKYELADYEEKEVTTQKGPDIIAPTISEVASSSTTNSVTLEVVATDNDSGLSGNYKFYIKKTSEGDEAYQEVQNNTSTIMTKEGLEQNTSYTIKVEVEDKAGNKETFTKDIETSGMPSITNPDGTTTGVLEQDGPTIWNAGKASIKLKTTTEYTIQYQVNNTEGDWISGITVSELKHGDTVYARLWDGINASENKNIIIQDNVSPIISEVSNDSTTNSVTLTVTATDNEAGLEDNPIYTFYIKKAEEAEEAYEQVQNNTNTTMVKEGLEENTRYTIKIEVSDKAGNKTSLTKTLMTKEMPSTEQTGAIEQDGSTTWNEGKASIKLKTNTEYTIQYQVNSTEGNWTSGTTVTNLNHNDTVYARLWDGTNGTESISIKVQDNVSPTMSEVSSYTTTNSVTLTVTASDNQAGMENDPIYTFQIKKTGEDESEYKEVQSNTNPTMTKGGLEQNVSYTIKVKVSDKAGNETSITKELLTKEMPPTEEGGNGAIEQDGSTTWENRKATVKLKTNTEYTIQYQVNDTEGKWTDGKTVSELEHEDIIYARLWDGTNASGIVSIRVQDNISPTMEEEANSSTTNSIRITVIAEDKEWGMPDTPNYVFYIKKESEGDEAYVQAQKGSNATMTKEGLEENTRYTIKIEVSDKAGNQTSLTKTILTKKMPSAGELEGSIEQDGETTWENGKGSIKLKTNTEYTIQYQVNNTEGNWTSETTVTNLNHNDIVYARLWDGTNETDSISIKIQDSTSPNIKEVSNNSTTNSVTLEVEAEDKEWGMDTNPTYIFYIKKTSEEDSAYQEIQNSINTSMTMGALIQNTRYTIKVKVSDKAGNETSLTKELVTKAMPVIEETAGALELDGAITWSNGSATVKFKTNTSYTIQYQKGSTTGTWIDGNTVTGLKHGDKIYARLWDGTNASGEIEIEVLDKVKPTVSEVRNTSTTNSVALEVTATDNESGLSGTYTFYIKKTAESDTEYKEIQNTTSATVTKEGLEQNTSYTIKVVVLDKAGNEEIFIKDIQTTGMPSLINPDGSSTGALEIDSITWSNEEATVKLKTNTSYTIQYQVNSTEGNWTDGNTVTGLKHGDEVYARLWDGANSSSIAKVEVKDEIDPTVSEVTSSSTTNSVTLEVTAEDKEWGMPDISSYVFYIKKASDSDEAYVQAQSGSNAIMIREGLEQSTTYKVKVVVLDKAGNEGIFIKDIETTGMPSLTNPDGTSTGALEVDGAITWSNGEATVKFKTNTSYTIQYQVNSTEGNWTDGNTVTGLKHGDEVYARLWDGINGSTVGIVEIKDTVNPTVSEVSSSSTVNSITLEVTGEDAESGLEGTYVFYIKKTSESDSAYQEVQNDTKTAVTATQLEQNVSYTIKVEVKDKAGNIGTLVTTLSTKGIDNASTGLTTDILKASDPIWIGEKAQITLSTTSSYTIQYQINSTAGTWLTGFNVNGLNHNDIVYARLTDGNDAGEPGAVTIIDSGNPNSAVISLSVTEALESETVSATVTQSDDQSGVDISSCRWVFNTDPSETISESLYPSTNTFSTSTSATVTLNNATLGTYYLHILTVDKAGNKMQTVSNSAVTIKGPVAKVGTKYFITLQDAIDSVTVNNTQVTVTLLENVKENVTIASHQNIYLDLDAYTLSNSAIKTLITNDGKLTITGGTVSASSHSSPIDNDEWGTLTIKSDAVISAPVKNYGEMEVLGTISYNSTTPVTNTGNLTVNGGVISTTRTTAIQNNSEGTITIKNGTISSTGTSIYSGAIYNDGGEVIVNGGEVKAKATCGIYSSSGSIVTITNGTISSESEAAISNGDVNMTISGGTIKSTSGRGVYGGGTDNSSLTIKGGTISSETDCGVYFTNGSFTMTAGTISNQSVNRNAALLVWCGESVVDISGGTISSVDGYGLEAKSSNNVTISNKVKISSENSYGVYLDTSTVEIKGGTISSTKYSGIYNYRSTLNVSGGTISSVEDNGIDNSTYSELNVSGGTISSVDGNGIHNSGYSVLNISKGTVKSTNGYGVYNDTSKYVGTVNITGGTISSTYGC